MFITKLNIQIICFVWLMAQSFIVSALPDLEVLSNARSQRVSSTDANEEGNGDCRGLLAGQTLTMAELSGPGRIVRLWFTVTAPELPNYARLLTLRVYWNNRTEPAIETPLGDFFASGHGLSMQVDSSMVANSGTETDCSYNCYWRMPFKESARFTITNDSEKNVLAVFWHIDWEKMDSLPDNTPYFHAQYRQEFPTTPGKDYLIVDTGETGPGHYVGTVLSVRARTAGWFGEGDDKIYIDGAEKPTMQGTGTEECFGDAWGFHSIQRDYYGLSLWEGMKQYDRTTAYRWYLADPIRFSKSLRILIENKGVGWDEQGNLVSGYEPRSDDYASVAFWYQVGIPKRFAAPYPAINERMPPSPYPPSTRYEIENLMEPLPTDCIKQPNVIWSGGNQILVTRNRCDAPVVEVPFTVAEEGERFLSLQATYAHDFGRYQMLLDGVPLLAPQDFYSSGLIVRNIPLGVHDLKAGRHVLGFRCDGCNPLSTNYYLGLDALDISGVIPEGGMLKSK